MISPRFFPMFSIITAMESASSSADPEPFKKLSYAAFALFIDPSIVVAASLDVVPVIPNSF